MLCTKCGEVIKPVVAVDIDGTLGDYHGHFLAFASAYLGRRWQLTQSQYGYLYDGKGSFREWFMEWFGVDERTWRDIKLAYRQGAQKRSMPIFPGAKMLCDRVRERAELWLTTTRPYLRLDNVDPDTRAWLARHDIVFDGLLYDEQKYMQLVGSVDPLRVAAVLEDEIEQYRMAESVFGWRTPVLRQTHWNRSVQGSGAKNMNEAWRQISKRLDEWEEENES